MMLDNMTGITKGSYTGFCKSQLITCNFVKTCNGVCPFEDALKHADKEMDKQTVIDHDKDWIIGCIEHDGFIHTDRFDKANQIIHDALSADAVEVVRCGYCKHMRADGHCYMFADDNIRPSVSDFCSYGKRKGGDANVKETDNK